MTPTRPRRGSNQTLAEKRESGNYLSALWFSYSLAVGHLEFGRKKGQGTQTNDNQRKSAGLTKIMRTVTQHAQQQRKATTCLSVACPSSSSTPLAEICILVHDVVMHVVCWWNDTRVELLANLTIHVLASLNFTTNMTCHRESPSASNWH